MRSIRGRVVLAVVMPLMGAVCLVLVLALVARDRSAHRADARPVEQYSLVPMPESSLTPSASSTSSDGTITVIGDSHLLSQTGATGWPRILARREGEQLLQSVSDGYLAEIGPGVTANTAMQVATAVDSSSAVVVLAGGASDRAKVPAQIEGAAQATIKAVERRAPAARIIVVGPVWTGAGDPPDDLLAVGGALRAAAEEQDATWLDPIAANWFANTSGATESDDVTTTAVAQLVIAGRVRQALLQSG